MAEGANDKRATPQAPIFPCRDAREKQGCECRTSEGAPSSACALPVGSGLGETKDRSECSAQGAHEDIAEGAPRGEVDLSSRVDECEVVELSQRDLRIEVANVVWEDRNWDEVVTEGDSSALDKDDAFENEELLEPMRGLAIVELEHNAAGCGGPGTVLSVSPPPSGGCWRSSEDEDGCSDVETIDSVLAAIEAPRFLDFTKMLEEERVAQQRCFSMEDSPAGAAPAVGSPDAWEPRRAGSPEGSPFVPMDALELQMELGTDNTFSASSSSWGFSSATSLAAAQLPPFPFQSPAAGGAAWLASTPGATSECFKPRALRAFSATRTLQSSQGGRILSPAPALSPHSARRPGASPTLSALRSAGAVAVPALAAAAAPRGGADQQPLPLPARSPLWYGRKSAARTTPEARARAAGAGAGRGGAGRGVVTRSAGGRLDGAPGRAAAEGARRWSMDDSGPAQFAELDASVDSGALVLGRCTVVRVERHSPAKPGGSPAAADAVPAVLRATVQRVCSQSLDLSGARASLADISNALAGGASPLALGPRAYARSVARRGSVPSPPSTQ